MIILSQTQVIAIFDNLSCAFLAAAASAKARNYGAHFTGAAILGCICGLSAPVLRETLLNGQPGTRIAFAQLPDDALLGAIFGILAMFLARKMPVTFLLDAVSISFAASLNCVLAIGNFGITGAITFGLIVAIVPGFLRDVALGNIADFVEDGWYVTTAMLGCVLAILILIFFTFMENAGSSDHRNLETAILSGSIFSFALQIWKRNKKE